jgi:hypothetical protein
MARHNFSGLLCVIPGGRCGLSGPDYDSGKPEILPEPCRGPRAAPPERVAARCRSFAVYSLTETAPAGTQGRAEERPARHLKRRTTRGKTNHSSVTLASRVRDTARCVPTEWWQGRTPNCRRASTSPRTTIPRLSSLSRWKRVRRKPNLSHHKLRPDTPPLRPQPF